MNLFNIRLSDLDQIEYSWENIEYNFLAKAKMKTCLSLRHICWANRFSIENIKKPMKYILQLSMLIFLFSACETKECCVIPPYQNICDDSVMISADQYDAASLGIGTLLDANITDDCLNIRISSSGCDGSSWMIKAYDSGGVAESLPEQRFIKISFENPEKCLAVFAKELSFDLYDLRVEGSQEIILNVDGWGDGLRYVY